MARERPDLGFKLFCIGLNRTGTTSFKRACRAMGLRHQKRQGRHMALWRAGRIAELIAETETHDSFCDWPWPLAYRQIHAHYGEGARFVLTRRASGQVWLDSLKRHAMHTHPDRHSRYDAYGYDYPHGAEAAHLAFYEDHVAGVRRHFAEAGAGHLLLDVCWDDGDGWDAFCGFLGLPAPRRAFPHPNASERRNEPDPAIVAENVGLDQQHAR
ncbi:MAG: sulfotransferase [Rubricella sp.]